EAEKGLCLLYHLIKGLPMSGMEVLMPKSSYHIIHSKFYKQEYSSHAKRITGYLSNMFSTVHIRLLSAKARNPPLFKQVTLHLDGHDTRASYGEPSAEMYSYKLKAAGLRTQVCMDPNGMAILVSKSQSCGTCNDGSMLVAMKIHNHMHELDCLALDGGYSQHIPAITEKTSLDRSNFCTPVRKKAHKTLAADEANYNKIFGSFRSQMESLFGELGRTFERHNNRSPVQVDKAQTYNLQMKLALLLLNIKRMVKLLDLTEQPMHMAWMKDGFDYPQHQKAMEYQVESEPVETMMSDATTLAKLQEEFLNMSM
ncbi:hypothetical protein BGZ73_001929, partial [Actinomortierella ambigua]